MQNSYATYHAKGYEGQRADSREIDAFAARNNSGAELPFGRFVVHDTGSGTSELAAKVISAATDKILGISLRDAAQNPTLPSGARATGIQDDDMFSVITEGGVYVLTKANVTPSSPVYVLFSGANAGRVQATPGGVTEIQTLTPTAANSTRYAITVEVGGRGFGFETTSDSSATATEICDAFRTLMAADTDFAALITATGTATLILTAASAGAPFKTRSTGAGTIAVSVTTPAAATAVLMTNARFTESASADDVVAVYVNIP